MHPLLWGQWIALVATLAPISDASTPQGSLALEVHPLRLCHRSREPIDVEVRVVNLTSEPHSVVVPFPWPNGYFLFEIIRPDGARDTNQDSSYPDDPPDAFASRWRAIIPPNSFVGYRLRLSTDPGTKGPGFLFAEAGEYRLIARLMVFSTGSGEGMPLQSDTATVIVRP